MSPRYRVSIRPAWLAGILSASLASSVGAVALAGAAPTSFAVNADSPTAPVVSPPAARFDDALAVAHGLPRLRSLLVAQHGEVVVEEAFRDTDLSRPVNIKSVSKVMISALVGEAIEHGLLPGVDASIVPLLGDRVPEGADPRIARITVQDLLTMRAGLERTSGTFYGRWIVSDDWVGYVLTRPFVDAPGGAMLYSTGSSHLLSAILTEATGRSTLQLAREWLGEPLNIQIPPWDRDPQGIYLGGNNMGFSPRGLLRFGEMVRRGGEIDGRRVLPAAWIAESWLPRTTSQFTGDGYGYGWFVTRMVGHVVNYAWGYGGQLLYIVPALGLTVVMTSDERPSSGADGYTQTLHSQVMARIVSAALAESRAPAGNIPDATPSR